jgi:hypothetical protein
MSTPATPVVDPKAVVPVVEAPVSPNAETDKRVSEVLNDKKKKKHPVEARIAELTKKNAAIEEKAAKDKAELESKLAQQNEKNIQAELDRRKAQAAADDKRPEKVEGQTDADFSQKMAEWVIRQQDKITPKVAAPVTPVPDPAAHQMRKEEFDGFLEKGKAFMVQYPDFNETLQKASERGLTMDNQAMVAIIRLKAPEVAYYLAKPENETTARKFMQMDGIQQVAEVGRIQERLAVHPNDFVSNAGRPGQRLNGNSAVDTRRPDEMDVDEYLKKRRADIKAGLRRR